MDFTSIDDELKLLYHALDGQLNEVAFSFDGKQFKLQSRPAIENVSEELTVKEVQIEIDENDLNAVFELLESGNEQKINKALDIIHHNKTFLRQANKRYLSLVRARLDDPQADLSRFAEAGLSKSETNAFLGKYMDKDFISLSYYDEHKSKLVVDVIGSLVKNAIDIETYIAEAKELESEEALVELYDKYLQKLKKQWGQFAKVNPTGWYSQICERLRGLKLERLLFEKTSFGDANHSLVLKEFWFYLNIHSQQAVYLDIHQSTEPELTEMFWLLRAIPTTNWSDTTPEWPDNPLSFKRSGRYQVGDFEDWKTVKR